MGGTCTYPGCTYQDYARISAHTACLNRPQNSYRRSHHLCHGNINRDHYSNSMDMTCRPGSDSLCSYRDLDCTNQVHRVIVQSLLQKQIYIWLKIVLKETDRFTCYIFIHLMCFLLVYAWLKHMVKRKTLL